MDQNLETFDKPITIPYFQTNYKHEGKFVNMNKNIVLNTTGRTGSFYLKELLEKNNKNLVCSLNGKEFWETLPLPEHLNYLDHCANTVNSEGNYWIIKSHGKEMLNRFLYCRQPAISIFLFRKSLASMCRSFVYAAMTSHWHPTENDSLHDVNEYPNKNFIKNFCGLTLRHIFDYTLSYSMQQNLGLEVNVLTYEDLVANPSKYFEEITVDKTFKTPYHTNEDFSQRLYEDCKQSISLIEMDALNMMVDRLGLGFTFTLD